MSDPPRDVSIQVVQRAMDVLGAFSAERPELSLTEVSAELGVYKSTAFRLLATLEAGGFVGRDPRSGRYRLGFRLLQIAGALLDQIDIRRAAEQPLLALANETQETIVLHALDDDHTVVVDRVASRHAVSFHVVLGERVSIGRSAAGKAILSHLPAYRQAELLQKIGEESARGPQPIDEERLAAELEAARWRGYVFHDGDRFPGVRAIGVAILNHQRQPIGGLALAGLAARLPDDRMPELAGRVMQTAGAISRAIGGPGTTEGRAEVSREPAAAAPAGQGR